ncbi:MAG: glycosyltransferase [Candidatus Aegiribacteria sp.]|nr:glycosyltransferase [Candidatus Aegiribacteria sp.]
MKKILFCIPTLTGGGAERVFTNLMNSLNRSKYNIELVLLHKRGNYISELNSDIVIHELKSDLKGSFFRLPRVIRKIRPDIVLSTICYMNIVAGFSSFLLRSMKIKFFGRESGIPSIRVHYSKSVLNANWLYRFSYRYFDKVICQSSDMRKEVHDIYRIPFEHIKTINNPIDIALVRKSAVESTAQGFFNDKTNLLAVGRLHPQKGYDLLLQALRKTHNQNIHLHILGTGELEKKLKVLTHGLDLSDRVSFHGFKSNPYPYMMAANLFVTSSIAEGFPNALLEALSLGCPAVAFDGIGGSKELIIPDINGSLVSLGDIDALAEELDRCSSIQYDREMIAKDIGLRYNIKKIVGQYEELFDDCATE